MKPFFAGVILINVEVLICSADRYGSVLIVPIEYSADENGGRVLQISRRRRSKDKI